MYLLYIRSSYSTSYMERYNITDNYVKNIIVNNKFYQDDIVFGLINEYDWSSETNKYISEIKINCLIKRKSTLVKYFAQFSKSRNK